MEDASEAMNIGKQDKKSKTFELEVSEPLKVNKRQ
jgi:hypothetical protein